MHKIRNKSNKLYKIRNNYWISTLGLCFRRDKKEVPNN